MLAIVNLFKNGGSKSFYILVAPARFPIRLPPVPSPAGPQSRYPRASAHVLRALLFGFFTNHETPERENEYAKTNKRGSASK